MSCFKCEKRNYPYCYEYCEDYLREKEEREKLKAERRKEREVDFALNDYAVAKYKRLNNRNR